MEKPILYGVEMIKRKRIKMLKLGARQSIASATLFDACSGTESGESFSSSFIKKHIQNLRDILNQIEKEIDK